MFEYEEVINNVGIDEFLSNYEGLLSYLSLEKHLENINLLLDNDENSKFEYECDYKLYDIINSSSSFNPEELDEILI